MSVIYVWFVTADHTYGSLHHQQQRQQQQQTAEEVARELSQKKSDAYESFFFRCPLSTHTRVLVSVGAVFPQQLPNVACIWIAFVKMMIVAVVSIVHYAFCASRIDGFLVCNCWPISYVPPFCFVHLSAIAISVLSLFLFVTLSPRLLSIALLIYNSTVSRAALWFHSMLPFISRVDALFICGAFCAPCSLLL